MATTETETIVEETAAAGGAVTLVVGHGAEEAVESLNWADAVEADEARDKADEPRVKAELGLVSLSTCGRNVPQKEIDQLVADVMGHPETAVHLPELIFHMRNHSKSLGPGEVISTNEPLFPHALFPVSCLRCFPARGFLFSHALFPLAQGLGERTVPSRLLIALYHVDPPSALALLKLLPIYGENTSPPSCFSLYYCNSS